MRLAEFAIDDCDNKEDEHGDDGDCDYPIRSHPDFARLVGLMVRVA
jgi:hypothetical protein